jgi:hypothetical protein
MQREFPCSHRPVMVLADLNGLTGACRWKYLEAGVSKIMINLQEGIDMQTVSISFTGTRATYADGYLQYMGVYT